MCCFRKYSTPGWRISGSPDVQKEYICPMKFVTFMVYQPTNTHIMGNMQCDPKRLFQKAKCRYFYLFSDILKLWQCWMKSIYEGLTYCWLSQCSHGHMITVWELSNRFAVTRSQHPAVTWSPFAIFFASFELSKSLGKPVGGCKWWAHDYRNVRQKQSELLEESEQECYC